jgi:hypothetical protein
MPRRGRCCALCVGLLVGPLGRSCSNCPTLIFFITIEGRIVQAIQNFMKKILLLLVIIISGSHLFAQSNPKLKELMRDPSITWIGEYETYFPFDIVNSSSLNDSISLSDFFNSINGGSSWRAQDIYSEKFQNFLGVDKINIEKIKQMWSIYSSDYGGLSPGQYLSNLLLFQWVKSGKLKAYYDSDLTKEISVNVKTFGLSFDTITIVNPETFEESDTVVAFEISPENLQLSKAKYYLYFDKKNFTWNIYTHSIAIVIKRYDNEGNFLGYESYFWIPLENSSVAFNYTDANYPLVSRSVVQVSYDKARVLKKDNSPIEANKMYMEEIRNGKSKKYISYELGYNKIKLDENFGVSVDTIFSKNTDGKDEIKVIRNKIDSKNIPSMRFVQDWYWDEKLHKLKVNFVAYAPIISRFDNDGNFIAKMPLFWEKMMKTKFDN